MPSPISCCDASQTAAFQACRPNTWLFRPRESGSYGNKYAGLIFRNWNTVRGKLEAVVAKLTTFKTTVHPRSLVQPRAASGPESQSGEKWTRKSIGPEFFHFLAAAITLLLQAAVLFLVCSMLNPVLAKDIRHSLPSDLSRTYGFYVGQTQTIERIKRSYPALKDRAMLAQAEFDLSFKPSIEQIRDELRSGLGHRWEDFRKRIASQIEATLTSPDEATAKQFIAEVHHRADGGIQTPVLETLLTYHPRFVANPHTEITSGFRQIYRTKGHPKAKGVDFQIDYPRSWRAQEGSRPNVVQKMVSKNGRGQELLMLLVKNLGAPPVYVVTDEELDAAFSEGGLRDFVPDGGTFVSGRPVVIDGQKGGMFIWEQTSQRIDVTGHSRNIGFLTVYKGKLLFLFGSVFSQEHETEARSRFNKLKPLFMTVANSLIIQDQY
jgi:hypothetical protein